MSSPNPFDQFDAPASTEIAPTPGLTPPDEPKPDDPVITDQTGLENPFDRFDAPKAEATPKKEDEPRRFSMGDLSLESLGVDMPEPVPDGSEDNDIGRVHHAINALIRATASGLASLPKAVDELSVAAMNWADRTFFKNEDPENPSMLRMIFGNPDNYTPEDMALFSVGAAMEDWTDETFALNPEYRGEFVTDTLSSGAGSMLSFLAGGAVTRSLEIPAFVGSGLMGAAVEGVGGAEDYMATVRARGEAVDPVKRAEAFLMNIPGGLTEAIPIERLFGRIDHMTGGGVRELLKEGFKGGLEELAQEVTQNIAHNAVARYGVGYDPDRDLFFGTAESGAAGFTLGWLFNTLVEAAGMRRKLRARRYKDGREPPEERSRRLQQEREIIENGFVGPTIRYDGGVDYAPTPVEPGEPQRAYDPDVEGLDYEPPEAVDPDKFSLVDGANSHEYENGIPYIYRPNDIEAPGLQVETEQQATRRVERDGRIGDLREKTSRIQLPEGFDDARLKRVPYREALQGYAAQARQAIKSSKDNVNERVDDLLTAIAKMGGLDRKEAESQGIDPAHFKEPVTIFGKPVFRKEGGKSFDGMAEILNQLGYFPPGEAYSPNLLLDLLDDALMGNDVRSFAYDPGASESGDLYRRNGEGLRPDKVDEILQKALKGEKLGVRESRVVSNFLDEFQGERTEPGNLSHARSQLEEARRARLFGGQDPEAVPDDWLFTEDEYDPRLDALGRTMVELADEIAKYGEEAADRAERAMEREVSDEEVIRDLANILKEYENEQTTHTAGAGAESVSPQPEAGSYPETPPPDDGAPAESGQAGAALTASEPASGPDPTATFEPAPQIETPSHEGVAVPGLDIDVDEVIARAEGADNSDDKGGAMADSPREHPTAGEDNGEAPDLADRMEELAKRLIALGRDGDAKRIRRQAKDLAVYRDPAGHVASQEHAVEELERQPKSKNVRRRKKKKSPKNKVEQAAQEAATHPENDLPEPTDAQKEAGNYKKGHVSINGLDIAIENPAGSRRRPEWPPLAHHYGYIKRTAGADEDASGNPDKIDVFIGPEAENAALPVFVVNQRNPRTMKFDEHKVMIGFKTKADARAAYLANYEKGWTGLESITEISLDGFKAWLKDGDTTTRLTEQEASAWLDPREEGKGKKITAEDVENDIIEKIKARIKAVDPKGEAGQIIAEVESTDFAIDQILSEHPALVNRKDDIPRYKDLIEAQKKIDRGRIREALIGTREIPAWGDDAKKRKNDVGEAGSSDSRGSAKKRQKKAEKSGYGEKNTVFTESDAEAARRILRESLGKLNAGIDPKVMQAGITLAGYHIEAGARKFADFARAMIADLGEGARPYLRAWYEGVRHWPGMDNSGMTPANDIDETAILSGEEGENAARTDADIERDRGAGEPAESGGGPAVQPGLRGNGESAGETGGDAVGGRSEQQGDSGLSDDSAGPAGAEGDLDLFEENGTLRSEGGVSGDQQRGRSGRADEDGVQVDRRPDENTERAAEHAQRDFKEKLKAQKEAENVLVRHGDKENIARTLPVLYPEQQEDVLKAENRFFSPPQQSDWPYADTRQKGMMFTNGTGTGKTYTGLGIAKRFQKEGKDNILIVTPTETKVKDWISDGKDLFLNISELQNTNTRGRGIVATTYANFRQNPTLAEQHWDLVIYDESHKLMENMQGSHSNTTSQHYLITNKNEHKFLSRGRNELRDEYQALEKKVSARKEQLVDEGVSEYEATDRANEEAKSEYADLENRSQEIAEKYRQWEEENPTRVVFLSATPWAGHKNVFYADGYLFDSLSGHNDSQAYNSGDNEEQFLVSAFGYRMRYNKANKPESGVDVGLLERALHERLREEGSLSGRPIEVDKDYSREFVLTNSGIGSEIDRGAEILGQRESRYGLLNEYFNQTTKGIWKHRMLEAVKAKGSLKRYEDHINLGRKVVVFHAYLEGAPQHPFRFPETYPSNGDKADEYNKQRARFYAEHPDLVDLDLSGLSSVPRTLLEHFGDRVAVFNGKESKSARAKAVRDFNEDSSGVDILVVQKVAGKEGISLHDVTPGGGKQRVVSVLGLPTSPTDAIQMEGRIYRLGVQSNAIFEYPVINLNFERWAYASTISQRVGTAENLAMGNAARSLEIGFKEGYLDPASDAPSLNQGVGGKESDRVARDISEFDRAKTYYYSRARKTARTKAAEGEDYFATPEPLGLKMVEWADIRPNDDVLEPSAGHGAIARFFPQIATVTSIEPSDSLASELAVVTGSKVVTGRFEDFHLTNKYDAIVMNPPFGKGGSTAIDHLAKAYRHLRDGGRIVAIIPTGPAADKKFEGWMSGLGKYAENPPADLYLTADIALPTVTFKRAATQVATRVVVMDKQSQPENAPQQVLRDYSNSETIEDLFGWIEDATIPPRTVVENAGETADNRTGAQAARPEGMDEIGLSVEKGWHTKKEIDIWTVRMAKRVSREKYMELNRLAKAHGGYYSRYAKGFIFESAAEAEAFAGSQEGGKTLSSLSGKSEFEEGLEKYFGGELKSSELVNVGAAPRSLTRLGIEDLDIVIPQRVLEKIVYQHGIPKSKLAALPDQLADPVMVFESETRDNSIVVLTDLFQAGDPVVVPLELSRKAGRQGAHFVLSMYGKGGVKSIQRWIRDGRLLYQNKQKSLEWSQSIGLQLPKEGAIQGRRRNIGGRPPDVKSSLANKPAPRGLSSARLQGIVDKIAGLWARGPEVVVLESPMDVPETHWEHVWSNNDPDRVRGFFSEKDGKVYLIASNIESNDRAVKTLLHESAHYGFRALFGEDINPMLRQVYLAYAGSKPLREIAKKYSLDLRRREDQLIAAEEMLAHMAETGQKPTLWKRLLAWINDWLRGRGFDVTLTDADLAKMIAATHRYVREGVRPKVASASLEQERRAFRAGKVDYDSDGDRTVSSLRDRHETGDEALDGLLGAIGKRKRPWKERVAGLIGPGVRDRFIQSSLDQFHGLKVAEDLLDVDAENSAYLAARMSTSPDAQLMVALSKGPLRWEGNRATYKRNAKGLLDILAPVADKIELWEAYMVARRARRLKAEGRENLLTNEQIAAGVDLARTNPEFVEVAREWAEFNKATLDFATEAGLIDADQRKLWEHDDYVPFYRILDEQASGPHSKKGLSGQNSGVRRLKGGTEQLGDILENMIMNTSHLIQAAMKNHALDLAIDNLSGTGIVTKASYEFKPELVPEGQIKKNIADRLGVPTRMLDAILPLGSFKGFAKMFAIHAPTGKDVVRVMRNGKPEYFHVDDPLVLRSLANVNQVAWGKWMDLFRLPKRWLTMMVTADPAFQLANFLRDTMQAFVISRDNMTPIFSGIKGAREALQKSDLMWDIWAAGGGFESGYINANDPSKTSRVVKAEMLSKDFQKTVLNTPQKLWDAWMNFSNAIENANRVAVAKGALEAGKTHLEAAFEAKDFMDFSMRGDGPIFQFLAQSVPFFNARLQGLYRLGRGAKENPRAFALRGSLIMLASWVLYWLNHDDDRYQALEEWDRDTYWHFWLGDQHYRLPKPFEVGVMFATVPERLAQAIVEDGDEPVTKFFRRIGWNAWEVFNLAQLPQTVAPIVEQVSNRNFFTGRPIEGLSLQRLEPEARYNAYTHETSIQIGRSLGLSPARIDHLLKGYFGSMGDYALSATDYMIRGIWDFPNPPAMRIDDLPVVKRFVRASPSRGTRYATEFYDLMRDLDKAYNTIRHYRRIGMKKEAAELLEERRGELRYLGVMKRLATTISQINQQIRSIHESRRLTPQAKRKKIDALIEKKNAAYRRVMEKIKGADQR